jgi:urea transport system permease protein
LPPNLGGKTFMKRLFYVLVALWALCSAMPLVATPLDDLLAEHRETILKGSRKTVGTAIDALAASGIETAEQTLVQWRDKNLWYHEGENIFYSVQGDGYFDLDTGFRVGDFDKSAFKQIKPNNGVRGLISSALVAFQLTSQDIGKRHAAVAAIKRAPDAGHLALLQTTLEQETDQELRKEKSDLIRLLSIQFATTPEAQIQAIRAVSGSLSVEVRAQLNPLLQTTREVAITLPENTNIAEVLKVGSDALSEPEAFDLLIKKGLAKQGPDSAAIKTALSEHIEKGRVAGFSLASLADPDTRLEAYDTLAKQGLAPARIPAAEKEKALATYVFFDQYKEPNAAITTGVKETLGHIETKVGVFTALDLGLDALSLASIYFLAAIGLAITFGVMGVINMAHGEFIMMGAYTGYVIQQFIPNHTVSILVAVPVAFAVTFCAGVAMERLVIRWLYNRPLETLLATFGVSIALQQLAKNIFGTQARPLTAPDWLGGAWVLNDVVSISYIRIAIFVLALLFFAMFLFIIKKTRLGLEMRAVTQNPWMASAMGINPDRVNMLTFGLGSGIAGIAGVAIGLFAKVTSEMGNDYIVQSFMSVVVGGVGNVWGTLAGAALVGVLQKSIEWFNPANTLAAQTYMILFIIIFIQFRPKGIIALKGRAAGD